MKKTWIILLIVVIGIVMAACGGKSASVSMAPANDLSGSYDRILADGRDKNDNYYALVAKQEESYHGYSISIGIIKNNQWLTPMTEDFPFLNENGLFVIPGYIGNTMECGLEGVSSDDFYYVQDGCFYAPGVSMIYNAEKKSYYQFNDWSRLYLLEYGLEPIIYTDDGKFAVQEATDRKSELVNISLFDVKTMTMTTLIPESKDYVMGPYKEGLVAVGYPYNKQVKFFCNARGEKVIDLSKYNSDGAEKMYFENGTFRFYVTNDLGSRFELTIDKLGTLINEQKM